MATIIMFFVPVAFVLSLCWYLYDQHKKKEAEEQTEDATEEESTDNSNQPPSATKPMNTDNDNKGELQTRELVIDTLLQLNCQPQFSDEEDDKSIYFTYQGGHFHINASDGVAFIDIWFTWWHDGTLDDIDELSNIRKTINVLNINTNVTTMYSMDNENNKIGVHSKKNILFMKEIPHIQSYLASMLGDFFTTVRAFDQILQQTEKENATMGK